MARWDRAGDTDVLAVHAALLQTGHILYFGGNQFYMSAQREWLGGNRRAIDNSRLYNCATGEITNPGSPLADLFCCGHAFLSSGDLLVAGGTERWLIPEELSELHHGHWPGLRDVWIFSAERHEWLPAARMLTEPGNTTPGEGDANQGGGRWYPTLLTLSDGKVIALAGHPSHGDNRHHNNIPEIYDPTRNEWTLWAATALEANLNNLGDGEAIYSEGGRRDRVIAFYPRAYVLPSADIFCADPQFHNADVNAMNQVRHSSLRFRADSTAPATRLAPPPFPYNTNFGNTGARFTSVLLPLLPDSYRARVMVCGHNEAWLIDLDEASPGWRRTGARNLTTERLHLNAVLLPTGRVFICGGVAAGETGVNTAELYDPVADRWENLEEASVRRGYHSVALLMPDGRIWTAGYSYAGDHDNGFERSIEIYTPWYCERSRPIISRTPRNIRYRTTFDVYTPQAPTIRTVALLRAGSCTHAFNSDQRYVGVNFTHVSPTQLRITAPPNGGVAPPGQYLLFIIDQDGVPSVGRFVNLNQPQPVQVIPSTVCIQTRGAWSTVFGEVRLDYPPLRSDIPFVCTVTAELIDALGIVHPLTVLPERLPVIDASVFFQVRVPPDLIGLVRMTAITNDPTHSATGQFHVSGPGGMGCRDPLAPLINNYEVIRLGCETYDCGWTAMNDRADLIGVSGGRPVRYLTARRMIDPIRQLVGQKAELRGINNHGQVIGVVNDDQGKVDGFIYGEPTDERVRAPKFKPVPGTSLTAINDEGIAVGGQFTGGRTLPVRFVDGQVQQIEVPSESALALAINGAGNIAGTHVPKGEGAVRAFIMNEHGFRDLGDLGGDVIGLTMNGGGAIAGTIASNGMLHCFAYSPEKGVFDLKMPIEKSQSMVSGINNMGMVVGTFWSEDGIRRAFRFTTERGAEDLNAFVSADRMLTLEAVVAINNRGQILTLGSEKGEPGYFLLNPASIPPPQVPIP